MVKFTVLIPLLIYYAFMVVFFTLSYNAGIYNDYTTSDITTFKNATTVNSPQNSTDWLDYAFALLGFIGLGIGLPVGTPLFIALIFAVWTWVINIIAIAMVIQVIRGS